MKQIQMIKSKNLSVKDAYDLSVSVASKIYPKHLFVS